MLHRVALVNRYAWKDKFHFCIVNPISMNHITFGKYNSDTFHFEFFSLFDYFNLTFSSNVTSKLCWKEPMSNIYFTWENKLHNRYYMNFSVNPNMSSRPKYRLVSFIQLKLYCMNTFLQLSILLYPEVLHSIVKSLNGIAQVYF